MAVRLKKNAENNCRTVKVMAYKAVLYKSHFPPLRHSVLRETPLYT